LKGTAVQIDLVSKQFSKTPVLKQVSLSINAGEFFSILGPSGCGKTTLLRMIAGLEEPDFGTILFDNIDMKKYPANKRKTNMIFQSYALFPHLSVYENVAFALKLKKQSKTHIHQQVLHYLDLVKLADHTYKMPSELSGGQKQRVAIARALVNQPGVLLLDEPLSALDAKLRQHMLVELDSIHDKTGITFIYITHDQHEALSVSDRVAVMDGGEILQIGTPLEIYESPATAFVADFIGETNFLEGEVTQLKGRYAFMKHEKLTQPILFDQDQPVQVGQKVKLTLRPEKIRVSRDKPMGNQENLNVFQGFVDEIIYHGFQSKFFILSHNFLFKAFKPHLNYLEESAQINWKEEVFFSWDADDSFLVEVLS